MILIEKLNRYTSLKVNRFGRDTLSIGWLKVKEERRKRESVLKTNHKCPLNTMRS